MSAKYSIFYFVYLIPTWIVILSIWYFFVDGVLYYCSDKIPLFDFIPPFVHSGVGDYFISPPVFVYVVWFILILLGLASPLFLTKQIVREINTKQSQKFRKHETHGK